MKITFTITKVKNGYRIINEDSDVTVATVTRDKKRTNFYNWNFVPELSGCAPLQTAIESVCACIADIVILLGCEPEFIGLECLDCDKRK